MEDLRNKEAEESKSLSPDQKKILISSLISLVVLWTLFLSVEAVLPLYVEENHNTLGSTEVAIIMVFTEVAGLVLSPLIGSSLEKLGRKNVVIAGFVTMSVGSACFAMTHFIKNDIVYLIAAIICRFI